MLLYFTMGRNIEPKSYMRSIEVPLDDSYLNSPYYLGDKPGGEHLLLKSESTDNLSKAYFRVNERLYLFAKLASTCNSIVVELIKRGHAVYAPILSDLNTNLKLQGQLIETHCFDVHLSTIKSCDVLVYAPDANCEFLDRELQFAKNIGVPAVMYPVSDEQYVTAHLILDT